MFHVVSDCQTRWLRLRQRFSKERQQQELETRSGAGRPTRKNWLLYDQLSFLGQFVFQRKYVSLLITRIIILCEYAFGNRLFCRKNCNDLIIIYYILLGVLLNTNKYYIY